MAHCGKCGSKVEVDDRFCGACGAVIGEKHFDQPRATSKGTNHDLWWPESLVWNFVYGFSFIVGGALIWLLSAGSFVIAGLAVLGIYAVLTILRLCL